jgi:hypothetical protein
VSWPSRSRRSLPSSAYVSIRQHTSAAYVRIAPVSRVVAVSLSAVASLVSIRQHTSAYVSNKRQDSTCQPCRGRLALGGRFPRQHQRQRQAAAPQVSAYVSIRQHTSAAYGKLQVLRCQYLYFCTSKPFSICTFVLEKQVNCVPPPATPRARNEPPHTASVSIRQHTLAYVSITLPPPATPRARNEPPHAAQKRGGPLRRHAASCGIRQHTSAYAQHT